MTNRSEYRVETNNSEQTKELGIELGQRLKGREVIELESDLGGGKTTFVKGLAVGMGSKDTVTSPSFTITNKYKTNNLDLYHFDFYRLNVPGIIRTELTEIMEDAKSVVVIEWPGIIEDVLPDTRLTIKISIKDDESRLLVYKYPKQYTYLIKNA